MSRITTITARAGTRLGLACLALLLVSSCDKNQSDSLSMDAQKTKQEIKDAEDAVGENIDAMVSDGEGARLRFPASASPVLQLYVNSAKDELTVGEPQHIEIKIENVTDRAIDELRIWPRFTDNFQIDDIVAVGAHQEQTQAEPAPAEDGRYLHTARLEAGGERRYRITGVATATGVVKATFAVDYHDSEAVVVAFKATQPLLLLDRQILVNKKHAESAYLCDELAVRYRISNRGSGAATALILTDTLPAGLSAQDSGPNIKLDIGTLASGAEVEKTVVLKASRAVVWQGRASLGNDALTVQSEHLQLRVMQPSLELQVEAPEQIQVGESATVRVEVHNTSQFPIRDLALLVPESEYLSKATLHGLEARRFDKRRLTIGNLAPQQSIAFTIALHPQTPGSWSGEIVAEGYCVRSPTRTIALRVRGVPALQIEAIDSDDPIAVGDQTTYRIRITNEGSAPVSGLRISASLSGHLQAVETERVSIDGQNLALQSADSLAPGEVLEWSLPARGTRQGQGLLELQVVSNVSAEPLIVNEPTTVK